jgi:5,10-methylenetetrahydrofolate reductase
LSEYPIPGSRTTQARLEADTPLVGVELRPPRTGMSHRDSIDVWIDMYHAMERLARRDTVIFLTDNAVGQAEEENLGHLSGNLSDAVNRRKVVPFLTAKHSLEYCHLYASRALDSGFEAITVLGGDQSIGPPRCVPHSSELRQSIRRLVPSLRLGGWANPRRDPEGQIDLLAGSEYEIDFYLTQIVSHHRLDDVERFVEATRGRGIEAPAVFGVFYYRSARPTTLEWLSRYFPVPAEELTGEFESGMSPVEVCAATIRALREVGADKVYVSNLDPRSADRLYAEITAAAET